MTGCWFPHGKFLIATHVIDWDADTFIGILLGETSNVLSAIGAQVVSDITLDEFTGTGYSRQTLTGTQVTEEVGVAVHFEADDVVFATLGNGASRARWTLIASDGANDGVRVPIFVVGRALGPINPNGGSIRAPIDAEW